MSTAAPGLARTGHGGTDDVCFATEGRRLFSGRQARGGEGDGIPDVWPGSIAGGEKERERTKQSFLVPKKEVAKGPAELA